MSVAGYLGDDRFATDHVRTSLRILAYGPDAVSSVSEAHGSVLGVTNDSTLWLHPETGTVAAVAGSLYRARETAAVVGAPADATFAEIACRAFLTFGDTFRDHLSGECAIVIVDVRQQRSLLSRDPMGRSPLFFAPTARGLVYATEAIGLLGWPGVDGRIADSAITCALFNQSKPGSTLWQGVHAVVPGATVVVRHGSGPVQTSIWDPLRKPVWIARDSRDYAEALRQSMVDAVAVRLPAHGQVASQLSAGFDSTGVTALAAQALAQQGRSLLAYTSVPATATRPKEILADRYGDEWPGAASVAAMYSNIEHLAVPTDFGSLWDSLDIMADAGSAFPSFIRNARWFHGILRGAQQRGAISMFEGQGGNLTSSYNGGFALYDLRQRRQWLRMLSLARQEHTHGTPWRKLLLKAWMPSGTAKTRFDRMRGRRPVTFTDTSLIHPDLLRARGDAAPANSSLGQVVEGDRTSGRTWRASILRGGDIGSMTIMEQRGYGLRREDPTADARLIELVLSMPETAFAPNGIPRQLYREAFRNDLPAGILADTMRGLQSQDFLVHFERDLPIMLEEVDAQQQDTTVGRFLDLGRMRTLLQDFHNIKSRGMTNADLTFNYTVGGALGLGRFLRRTQNRHQELQRQYRTQ